MCNGVKDNNGECCHIKDKNWIIGQVKDHEEVLKRVQKHYDKNLRWNDLFIDYDEGKKLFPNKPMWQDKNNYPAMRVNPNVDDTPCVFFDDGCKIHKIKSDVCKLYKCDWLKTKEEILSNKRDYKFVQRSGDDFACIQLIEGDFAGVVYKYSHIKIATEENENSELPLSFKYDIMVNPNQVDIKSKEFINHIGGILIEVVEHQLEEGTLKINE
tara:strand:- start:130 stop:768 length:639 start_codon:yes stop_codon:yes gene_type:complete